MIFNKSIDSPVLNYGFSKVLSWQAKSFHKPKSVINKKQISCSLFQHIKQVYKCPFHYLNVSDQPELQEPLQKQTLH